MALSLDDFTPSTASPGSSPSPSNASASFSVDDFAPKPTAPTPNYVSARSPSTGTAPQIQSLVDKTSAPDTSSLFSKTQNFTGSFLAPKISTKTAMSTPATGEISTPDYGIKPSLDELKNQGSTISQAKPENIFQKIIDPIAEFFGSNSDQQWANKAVQKTIVDQHLVDIGTQLGIDKQFPLDSTKDSITAKYNQEKQIADFVRTNYDEIKSKLTDPSVLPPHPELLGPTYSNVQKNIDSYLKEFGVRTTPTNMEFASYMMLAPVTGAFGPSIAVGFAGMMAFSYIEHKILGDSIAGKIADHLGIENQDVRNVMDLVEMFGVGGIFHSIYKSSPDVVTKFTKNIVTTYMPGQTVSFEPNEVYDMLTGRNAITTAEQRSIFNALGLDSKQMIEARKNGIPVDVSPQKIVTLVDKPYWSKIKQFFHVTGESSTEISRTSSGETKVGAENRPNRLLGPGAETINTGGAILQDEIKQSLETNGPLLTAQELQTKLGVDGSTANNLIQEVQRKEALANPQGLAESIMPTIQQPESENKEMPKEIAQKQNEEITQKTVTDTLAGNREDYRLTNDNRLQQAKDYGVLPKDATPQSIVPAYRVGTSSEIAPGDHISLTKEGAEKYLAQRPDAKLITGQVKVADLVKSGGTGNEFIYAPQKPIEKIGDPTKIVFDKGNAFSEGMVSLKEAKIALENAGYSVSSVKDILASLADKTKVSLGKQSVHSHDLKEAAFEHSTSKESEIEKSIHEQIQQEALSSSPAKELNKHFGRSSDTISQQLENNQGTARARFIEDKISELGYRDIDEAQRALDDYKAQRLAFQGGFIAPGQVVEDLKTAVEKTGEYLEQTNANITFAKNLDDTLYKGQKNSEADTIQNHRLQDITTKTVSQDERAHILDYRDKLEAGLPTPTLTEKEQQINDHLITPLYEDAAQKVAYIKGAGVPFSANDYSHRIAKDKGGPLDKLVEQKNKLSQKGTVKSGKNILKKSAPALKHREMFSATNLKTGERTVVHFPSTKEGNVTAFKNKELTNLGNKKSVISPRTKEFFDQHVTPVLDKLAKDLGITHIRTTQKQSGLGGNRAGVSLPGQNTIKTKVGTPERVILHEIGHQLDERYGLQELFKKDDARNYGRDTSQEELRALADLRIEGLEIGKDVSKHYAKSYIRSGSEKMAVMFEAYLHVPDKFKEVAPNIFEKFEEFLSAHPELHPIRDLNPSIVLGSKKVGGEHLSGLKGNTFISSTGEQYGISQATTAEIEQHSNVEYYHDPITAALFAHDDITRVFRAVQLLENLKNSPEFNERMFKAGEGNPPIGWKMVDLPQFRGYFFEPSTANVLNAFAQDLKTGDDPVRFLTAANNLLVSTMFLSPVKHLLNVGTSLIINRGATRWLNPLAYPTLAKTMIQSIGSIVKQDEDYIKILRAGAPMMAAKADQAAYRANVLASLGEKTDPFKNALRKGIKIGKAITPFEWAHKLTWPGNDMLLQQQIREELTKQGLSITEATEQQIEAVIREVTKILPSYRLPVTLRRIPKYATRNTLLFASYRYNLAKSFFELGKTVLTGDSPEEGNLSASAWKARGNAVNKILVMAFLSAIAMPYIDQKIKEMTGNNNAYLSDPGQLSIIDNANKLANGSLSLPQYIQTMIDLPPATKEFLQQFMTNTDWFTGKTIQTQGTPTLSMQNLQERLAHAQSIITPFDLTQKLSGGTMTIGQLLMAQLGIHEPKGNNLVNILQGSNANVLTEIARLNQTAKPPSSMDIENRPDVQIFKAELTPEKYNEAIKQFTGLFVSNIAKLMDNQYMKAATATSLARKLDYQGATDDQKSQMIDEVKSETIASVEKAYHYNKGSGTTGKAIFEGHTSNYGLPTVDNLSRPAADDGEITGKNPKGELEYKRFSLADSDKIRDSLYDQDPYWKDNGYSKTDVQLDHIVPIEAGGSMTKNNLMLESKMSDQLNQAFEDYLGAKYKAGTISRADAIKASVDYKINKTVSLTDIKNGKY